MTHPDISIHDFVYDLPDERIAPHPLADREKCKLLRRAADGTLSEHIFAELPELLPADAMLIYNNTRVINARLHFRKPSGAVIEIFCLEPHTPADYARNFESTQSCRWTCFVGNSKRWKEGELDLPMEIDGARFNLSARRVERVGNASVVEFSWPAHLGITFSTIIEQAGVIPIPPYLNRETEDSDATDYQTVYSHIAGSVAAPTAGLHFTDRLLDEISGRGIPRRELTLHVGAGTFQPVKDDNVADHTMHSEFISVPASLIAELAETTRRVTAVGTTSVRTLESLYHAGCLIATGQWTGEVPQWYPYSDSHPDLPVADALRAIVGHLDETGHERFVASTRIIIAPGYRYRIVRSMITNFHQPASTLLLLVSAFTGGDWRPVYDYALAHSFRILSYGDACLLES